MLRLLLVVAIAAGCGTSAKPAGAVCAAANECESGLGCDALGQFSGSACSVVGKVCTHSCTVKSDCTDLGLNFDCFATCGSGSICGATSAP